jgi:hypothetical protein
MAFKVRPRTSRHVESTANSITNSEIMLGSRVSEEPYVEFDIEGDQGEIADELCERPDYKFTQHPL